MHVHVTYGSGKAKFWPEPEIELAENPRLNQGQLNAAERLVRRMSERSAKRGTTISDVEIDDVSEHGFWLRIGQERLHVPYAAFPWFRHAPLDHVLHVTMPHPDSLRWPDLDIDLAVESIRRPEGFPLVYR